MQQYPMTLKGFDKLNAEYKDFKSVQRPAVVIEIDIARSHGDLKENAEYHAAKEKQSLMETRISELEDIIANSKVIDPSILAHQKVSFGSTVKLLDLSDDKEIVYTIVGIPESNPEKNRISFSSPLARSLVGKEEGVEVSIDLPNGKKEFEILEIFYKEIEID
jgi:transcription elongation factor GreA